MPNDIEKVDAYKPGGEPDEPVVAKPQAKTKPVRENWFSRITPTVLDRIGGRYEERRVTMADESKDIYGMAERVRGR